MIKKLLIAYSHDDRDLARKLRQSLLDSKYDVWIAEEDIKGEVMWTQAILDAIENTDGIVLIWSANAAKSEYAKEEIRTARAFLKPIFPLLAHPMKKIPSLFKEISFLQVIAEVDFNSNIAELKARLSDPNRSTIKYPEFVENVYIPRHPNPYFVGRNNELKQLFIDTLGFHGETKKGIPIAVSGLGGIGKTQLALTFGYRFNLFFSDGVYWVDTPNGIIQEFEKIGNHLKIERHREEHPLDYATRVYEKLCQLCNGLVIFDNVVDFAEFQKWCPAGSKACSVILTTRKSPRGFAVKVINLNELDTESAYKLIISRRRDYDKIRSDEDQQYALRKICNMLGNHPLALELCASYFQSTFVKPTDFLKDLEKDPLGHLATQPQFQIFLAQGDVNLLEVLRRNYESLNREKIDPYFLLMCCFAPSGINAGLIINAYREPKEGAQALEDLAANSLIYREAQNVISLHPLVAQFGISLQKTKSVNYFLKFVEVIFEFLQGNKNNLQSEDVRKELPHVLEAIRVSREHALWSIAAQLHEYCAEIVIEPDTQIEMLEKAHEIIKDFLPDQKRKLPSLCVRLGKARRTKGLIKDALIEFNKAETLYAAFSEADPREIASLQFEQGDAYLALGQYEEARKSLARALDTAKNLAHYDLREPEVTRIKQALARRDFFLGDYDSAERSFNAILKNREEFHSIRPDADSSAAIGSSYADLSRLFLERGNYLDAVSAAEKALTIIKEYHKENDPVCGNVFLLLGTIHNQFANYGLAEQQIEKARLIYLAIFGEKHPSYARTLMELSAIKSKLGKFKVALENIEPAIEIFENRYGAEHPSVAEAFEVQGRIYSDIGNFEDALKKFNRSIEIVEKNFGELHSKYLISLINLASCHCEMEGYSVAEEIIKEATSLSKRIFGESPHPYVADIYQRQSEIERRLGRLRQARQHIRLTIAMKRMIYSDTHPSLADAYEVFAKISLDQGRLEYSKTLFNQVLRIRDQVYGTGHLSIGNTLHGLGQYYLCVGDYDRAIINFQKALEISSLFFGEEHLLSLDRVIDLANAYFRNDNCEQALLLLEKNKAVGQMVALKNPQRFLYKYRILKGRILTHLKQYPDALQEFNYATELNPKDSISFIERGNAYRLMEQWTKALIDFEKAKQIDEGIEWVYEWIQSTIDNDKERTNKSQKRLLQLLLQKLGIDKYNISLENVSTELINAYIVNFDIVFKKFSYLSSFPILFLRGTCFTENDVEHIIKILMVRRESNDIRNIAIIISFLDSQNSMKFEKIIKGSRQSHAINAFVLEFNEAWKMAERKTAVRMYFRQLVLSRINLTSLFTFVTRGPSTALFVGREKELSKVVEQISNSSFAIVGGRLIGKTSMLRILHLYRLPAAGFRSVYLDCSYQKSCNSLLTTYLTDWKPDKPSSKRINLKMIIDNGINLKREKMIVLLLDEIDKLIKIDSKERWKVFNVLRALAISGQAQTVFCGELLLMNELRDPSSPMFNFPNEILLKTLDEHSVKELVTRPFKNLEITFEDEDEIVKRIYDFTGGHPNIVQRLCGRLLENLCEVGSRRISLSDLNKIISDPIFQEKDFLAIYWDRATTIEKIISLILSMEDKSYNLDEVNKLVKEKVKINVPIAELDVALQRLVELRSILRKKGSGYEYNLRTIPEVISNSLVFEEQMEILTEKFYDERRKKA